MLDQDTLAEYITCTLHGLFYLFVVVPYFYLEALYKLILPDPPKSVKGEIVLITGTGHGIGKSLALKYAFHGAIVVGWDVNKETNEETIKAIKSKGSDKAYAYTCDVSNKDDVFATAKKVQEEVGNVTILINCAGIMPTRPFLDHTPQVLEKIVGINLMSHFWTLQTFLPSMRKNNKGHVVAVASMAGLLGVYNLAPYCASKYAVVGLMEALHEEIRRLPNNQIQLTTVCPFMVDTGLCKRPDIRYGRCFEALKTDYVADKIFEAQIKNKGRIVLPLHLALFLKLKEYFPKRSNDYFFNAFKVDFKSDLDID